MLQLRLVSEKRKRSGTSATAATEGAQDADADEAKEVMRGFASVRSESTGFEASRDNLLDVTHIPMGIPNVPFVADRSHGGWIWPGRQWTIGGRTFSEPSPVASHTTRSGPDPVSAKKIFEAVGTR